MEELTGSEIALKQEPIKMERTEVPNGTLGCKDVAITAEMVIIEKSALIPVSSVPHLAMDATSVEETIGNLSAPTET